MGSNWKENYIIATTFATVKLEERKLCGEK